MADKTIIRESLAFEKAALKQLQEAYLALLKGGVKSYMIDDRQLTKFDIPVLREEMKACEDRIDELTALLEGKRPRKAFGILPRDW